MLNSTVRPIFICVYLLGTTFCAASPGLQYGPLAPELKSVPQTLLNLIHAPEVQSELKLTAKQFESFLPLLQQIDGPWWRARILPEAEQRTVTAKQEQLLIAEMQKRFGAVAVQRLRQIELQSQGFRMLLRPEVIAYAQLTEGQLSKLKPLFEATDAVSAKIAARRGQADAELTKELDDARKSEMQQSPNILSPEQQSKIMQAVGKVVDTSKLERIYPLAPELIDSETWFGTTRPKLNQLRGKVVLVHFYAFQCHNCQANFHIYNRWQKALASKGVQLIGIQTPETSTERDPSAVSQAAEKDGFKFPVLIDLKNDNWNAWSNTMWPTVYVIDKQGYVRFWWQGELNWQGATVDQTIEKLVDRLLVEPTTQSSSAGKTASTSVTGR